MERPHYRSGRQDQASPGRFELVATSGHGALSICIDLPVAEPDAGPMAVSAKVKPARDGDAVRLKLLSPEGTPEAGLFQNGTRAVVVLLNGQLRAPANLQSVRTPDRVGTLFPIAPCGRSSFLHLRQVSRRLAGH